MFAVAGPQAGEVFAFRVDAKQKITVGADPIEIDAEIAECYIESGHLEEVKKPSRTKKAGTTATKPKTDAQE